MTKNRSLFVCLMGLGLFAACDRPEPPAAVPKAVVVFTVSGEADAGLQIYSGEVRARHEADLSFRVGGKLVERHFNLGDRVRKGQVLARIDAQDARLATHATAAQVAAAEADVALARIEYERAQRLYAQNFISGSALDARHAQFDAAQARLRQANAQAGVSDNQLSYAVLSANRDGVITAAPVEAGQVVAPGQPIARLADPAQREVLIWVPETRVAQLAPGQAAFVRTWSAQQKTLAGTVREIAASADPASRTYAVRVSVASPDESLSLGATAAVAFQHALRGAVTLPLSAVVGKGDAAQVWTVEADGSVQARPVSVLEYRDDVAVIGHGLQAGDRVVTLGSHLLSAGLKVAPVDAKAPVALDLAR